MKTFWHIFCVITVCVVMVGCVPSGKNCRFNALIQANEMKRQHPELTDADFRFAYSGKDKHVQAQVRLGGEWKWLNQSPSTVVVYIGKQYPFEVEKYMTLDEYFYWIVVWGLQ